MTLPERLAAVITELQSIYAELSGSIPPIPGDIIRVQVTRDPRASARYTTENNASGYPIFKIYPSDSSTTRERIQFPLDAVLEVHATQLRGDSGVYCYKLYDPGGRYIYAPLFVRVIDVERI